MAVLEDYTISYAQNREDMVLAAFFEPNETGFYIDVGANYPDKDSVTKYFYDKGWHGINVEPNSRLHKLLERDRPRDINLKVGVSETAGELKLREYEETYDGLSTFSEQEQKKQSTRMKYEDKVVPVQSLAEICKANGVTSIQFMKVDVEGFEYEVLAGNDWKLYRPEVICIEANHVHKDWRPILADNGYEKAFFDGLNEYYVANESKKRAESFSYVHGIIGRNIVESRTFSDVVDTQTQLLKYKAESTRRREEAESWRHEVNRLNAELVELQRVMPLTKRLLKSLDAAVRRRIDRLNTRKSKQPQPFIFDQDAPKQKLLQMIKLYDADTYYRKTPKKNRLRYVVVVSLYEAISQIGFGLMKTAAKVIRKIRR
jgi:FkbM family methyltransferase